MSGSRPQVIQDGIGWKVTAKDVAGNEKLLRAFLSSQRHLSHACFATDVFLRLNRRVGGNLFGRGKTQGEELRAAMLEAGKLKKLAAHLLLMKKRAAGARDPACCASLAAGFSG